MAILDDRRADWDARPPTKTVYKVDPAKRRGHRWHWPGSSLPVIASHDDCLELVASFQRYHQRTQGWSDIGYNALICNRHGRAIEGRGLDTVGAHSHGNNTADYGTQIIIGFGELLTDAAKARAVKLHRDLLARSGPLTISVHSDDGSGTACAGPVVNPWIHAGMPLPIPPQEDPLSDLTVKNPHTGEPWPIDKALWSIWTYVLENRAAIVEARELSRAATADLSPAELDAIQARVEAALAEHPQESP